MSAVTVVTVARRGDLPGARVLAKGLREHNPGWRHLVVLLPGAGRPPLADEPFDVIEAHALASHDFEQLAPAIPLAAAEALARALAVDHALREGAESVVTLAPDCEVHGPLDALVAPDADAVLVPRVRGELPGDAQRPDAQDLLEAGSVEDGVHAVRASDAGRDLVAWWCDRAREAALATRGSGELHSRALANPLDAAPHTGARVAQLDDPGIGASYWNLHERPLARDAAGRPTAAGERLALVRFAGFRPDRPWWLARDATRVPVLDDPVLSELCSERSAALLAAGWESAPAAEGLPSHLPNGLRLDERLRRLYVEALQRGEEFGDILTPAGAESFTRWLCEPAPQGARAGITRYHHDVWLERRDVREAYPELDGAHGEGFAGWLWTQGRPEMELQTALMPPWPAFMGEQPGDPAPPAVLVTGYLRGNLGLGEAARGYVAALEAAGVATGTRALSPDPPVERLPRGARRRPQERAHADRSVEDAAVNLLCLQPDQVVEFAQEHGEAELRERYTIGHWAWETDHVPERWSAAYALVDELWVNSTFVAESLSRAGNVPVVVIPTPVAAPDPAGARVPFELPGGFLFLFAFDHFSTIERKNPLGLIAAYRSAFEPGDGAALVIKTINAEFRPEAHAALRHASAGRDDILIVDASLEPEQLAALYERADCYVSLHRSEGFGLTLAETMAMGKPVIATGWSGNTDFMSPHNSWLVDHELRAIGSAAEHYPAQGRWAEPSIEHAATLMREVFADPVAARARGERARADVRTALGLERIGALAAERLARIATLRGERDAGIGRSSGALAALDEHLWFDLDEAPAPGGARATVQKAVMRALRPYARRERALDEVVVASLHELAAQLAAERGARERASARIAELQRRLDQLDRGES